MDGIDGGACGAAVRLLGIPGQRPVAIAVATWEVDGDTARVVGMSRAPGGAWTTRRADVGSALIGLAAARLTYLDGPALALCVEDAHVGVDPRAAISVARAAGVALAGWSSAWPVAAPVRVVGPDAWRRLVGVPNRKGQRKTLAAQVVPTLVDLAGVPDLTEHVVDAAGVALCGLLHEAWGPLARWRDRVGGKRRARAVKVAR